RWTPAASWVGHGGGTGVWCGLWGDASAAALAAERPRVQSRPLPPMEGHAAAKARQRKIRSAVTAVKRPEQRKQRRVLADRQELAVGQGPALRSETASEHPYPRQEWIGHELLRSTPRGKDPD